MTTCTVKQVLANIVLTKPMACLHNDKYKLAPLDVLCKKTGSMCSRTFFCLALSSFAFSGQQWWMCYFANIRRPGKVEGQSQISANFRTHFCSKLCHAHNGSKNARLCIHYKRLQIIAVISVIYSSPTEANSFVHTGLRTNKNLLHYY